MALIDDLKRGAPGSGAVRDPDQIVTLRVMADVR